MQRMYRPFFKISLYSLLSLQNFAWALFSISLGTMVSPKILEGQERVFINGIFEKGLLQLRIFAPNGFINLAKPLYWPNKML